MKKVKPSTIRHLLFVYNTVFIGVLVSFIILGAFSVITKTLISDHLTYSVRMVANTMGKVDSSLQKFEMASRIIGNDQDVQNELEAINNSGMIENESGGSFERHNEIFSIPVVRILDVTGDINSVGIYTDKNSYYYYGSINSSGIGNSFKTYYFGKLDKLKRAQDPFLWIKGYPIDGQSTFSILRYIIDTDNFDHIGYQVMNINTDFLTNVLNTNNIDPSAAIYISDDMGNTICGGGNTQMGDKVKAFFDSQYAKRIARDNTGSFITNIGGIPLLVAFCTSDYTGWKLVTITPLSAFFRHIFQQQIVILLIGLAAIIVLLALSQYLKKRISGPIEQLKIQVGRLIDNDFRLDYQDDSLLETQELGRKITEIMAQFREMVQKLREGEQKNREIEFSVLQAQINPHFVYNTLETINYLCILENKDEIGRMVAYLGDTLRYSTNCEQKELMLWEEIQQVKKYLYIEKVRFGSNLTCVFDIAEDTRGCMMLKMLIQPIVENAIHHGLSKKAGGGRLVVTSRRPGADTLLISIADNGIGMSESMIQDVLSPKPSEQKDQKHPHLGIRNVNERIRFFYGAPYGVDIRSMIGKGTCVNLTLKAIEREG